MSIAAKRGIHFIPGSAHTIHILPNTQKTQFLWYGPVWNGYGPLFVECFIQNYLYLKLNVCKDWYSSHYMLMCLRGQWTPRLGLCSTLFLCLFRPESKMATQKFKMAMRKSKMTRRPRRPKINKMATKKSKMATKNKRLPQASRKFFLSVTRIFYLKFSVKARKL